MGYSAFDYVVINLQRVALANKCQLLVLHVDNPIGQYIHVHVISSQITGNGYAWGATGAMQKQPPSTWSS